MRTEYVLAVKEEWVDGVYCFDRSVGPVLDWTDNREKDPLDESHRPAHLLCAHDGLGGKLFALGEAALDQFDLRWVADPYLTRLRDQTQQTALLSVPANGEAVVLACVEFRDRLAITSRPGNRPPPHCSSQGRIALAFADEEARRRVLSRKLTAFTKYSITDRAVIDERLRVIRERFYEDAVDEIRIGINAVSAPVFRDAGELVGIIGIVGTSAEIGSPAPRTLITTLHRIAGALSAELGCRIYAERGLVK